MKNRALACLIVGVAVLLGSCGGGGGGGGGSPSTDVTPSATGSITVISGNANPPATPGAAPAIESTAPTPPSDMLLSPGALYSNFPSIAQSVTYTFDPEPLDLRVSLSETSPTDVNAYIGPGISFASYPGDATLGELQSINVLTVNGVGIPNMGTAPSYETLGGLPAAVLGFSVPGGVGSEWAAYAVPYSPATNPNGFTYQTFGAWLALIDTNQLVEGYFSTGVPTDSPSLPASGTAAYDGYADGKFINAQTREPFTATAAIVVSVDFSTRTVTLSSTNSLSLSENAANGAVPSSNNDLNIQGTLSYVAGSNTFTGVVAATNGMTGNVTGRFYGAPIAVATPNKPVGTPPEIGGTFIVQLAGVGVMQAAFGSR